MRYFRILWFGIKRKTARNAGISAVMLSTSVSKQTEWLCWQSTANSSPPEFPANSEIYSESARFQATCFALDCPEEAMAQSFLSSTDRTDQELNREF
jgi:hypothetical protein